VPGTVFLSLAGQAQPCLSHVDHQKSFFGIG
jgi:hypothetical protein